MAKKITIDTERCKGCTVCTNFCPQKILFINEKKINHDGYTIVDVSDINKCTGCGLCCMMCPDSVLKVKEEK
ncbi:MAG: 4Fe-4S dicluster domain-containing protein [Mycoplasmataceae bacterium]|jgi:2-oxoglutarate ferredoxin oxidoreductase subunit delta|nr:4Fe-4S dicluster domain-containing protein [Mycoplasmataceae bacterium]